MHPPLILDTDKTADLLGQIVHFMGSGRGFDALQIAFVFPDCKIVQSASNRDIKILCSKNSHLLRICDAPTQCFARRMQLVWSSALLFVYFRLLEALHQCLNHLPKPEKVQNTQSRIADHICNSQPRRYWQTSRSLERDPNILIHPQRLICAPQQPTTPERRDERYAINQLRRRPRHANLIHKPMNIKKRSRQLIEYEIEAVVIAKRTLDGTSRQHKYPTDKIPQQKKTIQIPTSTPPPHSPHASTPPPHAHPHPSHSSPNPRENTPPKTPAPSPSPPYTPTPSPSPPSPTSPHPPKSPPTPPH